MIHPCGEHTDREIDRRAIAYSALSIYAICCHMLKMSTYLAVHNSSNVHIYI